MKVRGLLGWTIARVDGDSMAPTLLDGDYVVARQGPVDAGAVALVEHPSLGLLIKRIESRDANGGYRLTGDNITSTPAEMFGVIKADKIRFVVRWRISPEGMSRVF